MSGTDWYLRAWKRSFDVSGRSQRKEFAYFFVVTVLVGLALLGTGSALDADDAQTMTVTRILMGLFFAAIVVPRFTLTIRRLHDIDLTGWLALLGLVPYAGLVLDVFCLIADSNPRPNKWGVSPKFKEAQRWMASLYGESIDCKQ